MFLLVMPDNDIYFFRGQPGRKRCPVCGQLTDKRREELATVSIRRRPKVGITTTADGVCVLSAEHQRALAESFRDQLDFKALQLGLFAMMPRLVVPFDTTARKTCFGKRCDTCGEYESVTGATPVYLKAPVPSDRIARTDLEFGSDDEKAPLFLVGDDAADRIARLRLSGCELVRQP